MSTILTLDSDRLRLRPWRDDDLPAFAALNADPQVMRYFPATMTAEESRTQAERIRAFMQQHGWGLWAVEVKGGTPFIGFVGLARPGDDLPCSPAWRSVGGWRRPTGATATPLKRHALRWRVPSTRCTCRKWCPSPPKITSRRAG